MDEKKTFKQQVKDWWQENKRVIKVSITCGVIGIGYGFIKGMNAANDLWLRHGFERAVDDSDDSSDNFCLTEENCDDPELLEMIKTKIENS